MRKGFTLVEVLVAMTILMVIVLMMANLMRHSSNAWDVGLRNVGMSMEGRTALDLMGRELSAGVMDELLSEGSIVPGEDSLSFSFYVLGNTADGSRAARWVSYDVAGGVVTRSEVPVATNNYPWLSTTPVVPQDLIDGIKGFKLLTPGGASFTTNMPAWVDLWLELEPTRAENATVKVWSYARDETRLDTNQWVRSWR